MAKSQRREGVVLSYANLATKTLVNLAYTPMLLAFVGQADYGVYQTCNSFVYSLSLLSFGFSAAYMRFYTLRKVRGAEEEIEILNGMFVMLYAVICMLAIAVGLILAFNAGVLFTESFTRDQVELAQSLIAIMTFSIASSLFSTVFDAYILAHEQFRFQQSRQLLTTLATPALALGLLALGMGAVGVAWAQLAVNLLLLTLNARFAIRRLQMRFQLKHFDKELFRALAVFSGWIFITQICDLVNQNVPNMILGMLTSATVVAVFAASVQVRSVFISLSTAISNVFVPEINRIVATSNDNRALTGLMARVGRYQMLIFCWVYGGFVILGRFFIDKWAGPGFVDAYWMVLAMALPLGVPLVQNTGIEIQKAKNMHHARSLVYLVMAAINVVFTWFATPVLSYWAPVVAYVISITLGNGLWMNWYYHRRVGLDMKHFWRKNLPVFLCAGVVTGVCVWGTSAIPVTGWFAFLLWGILYSIIFAAAEIALVATQEERALLLEAVRKLTKRSI